MTIPHNLDQRGLRDREPTDRHDEFVGLGEGSAADLDDHIVLEDALFRGTAGFDLATRAPEAIESLIASGNARSASAPSTGANSSAYSIVECFWAK